MQRPRTGLLKKPYKPPILMVHGTVKDLTQKVGPVGQSDNGPRFRIRTHI